ncbi:MAG TPA: hypothetical protein VGQ08_00580, partial [Nitrospiraceae bacterium]|nr:hypothetical protein [Nitrospiraceae bacterium]
TYIEARELCEQLGETPQLFPVLWGLARMHDSRGELRVGRELGEQLLNLAQRLQEPALLLEAHHELWANLSSLGELTSAKEHCERGRALYDPQKHKDHAFLYGGHDPGVCCGHHAATLLWLLGYPDQALQRSQNSLALARELAHPYSMAHALFWAAWLHQHRGEGQSVRARVDEGMTLATEQGFPRWLGRGTVLRGWLLVEQGQREAGIIQMLEGMAVRRARAAAVRDDTYYAALLAEAYRKTGQRVEGLNVVADALAKARQTESRTYEAELHRIKGELLLRQAVVDEEQAESCFKQAIDVARVQQAKSWELRAAMSLSRLWQRQGKRDEARELLGTIYGWFTEGFDTGDLKAAKGLLDELTEES